MPPGDTIILKSLDQLPDSVRYVLDSLLELQSNQISGEEKRPQFLFPQWEMFLFILLIAWVSAYFYIIRPASAKKRKLKKIVLGNSADSAIVEIKYDQWLRKYNPYYLSLTDDLKERFLRRTILFKESKEFHYHFMEPEEQIPVLISGAAVQLTFGLKKYLIDFFPVINVIKSAYTVVNQHKILEGHVQVNNHSINISWDSFIEDYEDYTDSANLGLHEMAHTISCDFLYGNRENRNAAFVERFRDYVREAGPVFKESLRQGKNDMFDDYGTLNVEEFWAVSIETFFENALAFKAKMPGLYNALCEVLNQDPLREEKIIDKKLAGLAS